MTETQAIAVVSQSTFLAPAIDISGALARYEAMGKFIAAILKEGTDYGKVPGSDKPTLLKPGAEKLASFFGLTPRFPLEEKVEDWTGADHGGEPFFYYRYKCQLYKGDILIAEGEGSCNSWEKKYRYRQGTRVCPKCGQPAIFKSKTKPEWYCWSKKGGCGATFRFDDKSIMEQDVNQTKNPDPAEQVNTIQKMAQKRALVAPVLIATNASERFTQDIEDFVDADYHDIPEPVKPTMTAEQALSDLGFDTPKSEGGDPFSGVCTSEGVPYSELSLADLSNRFNSLNKSKAKTPAEFTPEQQRKLDAAKHYIDILRAKAA